jgi:hypothetical protein
MKENQPRENPKKWENMHLFELHTQYILAFDG